MATRSSIKRKPEKVDPDAVVLRSEDLARIKASAIIVSDQKLQQDKLSASQLREQAREQAQARKERMLKLEEEKKRQVPLLSDFEREELEKKEKINQAASKLRAEESEIVVQMNNIALYAKCVATRDKQLQEKKKLAETATLENKRMDELMESERQRQLAQQEQEEEARAQERKKGAEIIQQQIEERERERAKQQELKEIEAQLMLKRMQELDAKADIERKRR